MNLHITWFTSFSLIFLVIMSACAISNPTDKSTQHADITIDNPDLPLLEYMRRIPGLQITQYEGETNIMVRGASTISGENSPLYIIDNSPIGHSFSQLENSISVSDIATIQVLRSSDAMQRYGMRAANGAIIVHTKKD